VWCPGPWGPIGDALVDAGIETVRFKLPRALIPHRFFQSVSYLKRNNFQIFHSYGYWPVCIDAVIAKSAGIPVYVSSRRNIRHWTGGERLHFGERIKNHFSDLVIANSEAVKAKSLEIEKLSADKVRVIHNGIEFTNTNLSSDNGRLRRDLGIPEDCVVVGNLANLKPVKGQGRLIRAFADASRKVGRIKLVIAGEGPEKANLLALADTLNVKNDVLIVDSCRDVFALLGVFDIFAFSSLAEGFPNAVIEAMAMAKPIVASSVGGIPEAVRDGENGFLFETESDFTEKLITLIQSKALRQEMGTRSAQIARESFSLHDKIREYEELYANLLCCQWN
jgi:glycosyltransferase involved in cell wall biosynthesis